MYLFRFLLSWLLLLVPLALCVALPAPPATPPTQVAGSNATNTTSAAPAFRTLPPIFLKLGNYNNHWQACGDFPRGRMLCPDDHVCIDNPEPWTCGQECGDYGVCAKKSWQRCGMGYAECGGGTDGAASVHYGRCRRTIFDQDCVEFKGSPIGSKCLGICFHNFWQMTPDKRFIGPGSRRRP